jgi:uncharacterized protein (DUF2062 family)
VRVRIARGWRRCGLAHADPETVALAVALGLTLGVCPIYGAPTLLCLAAGWVLRPHVPLLQAINAASSPLQFALLLPFHALGTLILPRAMQSGAPGAVARVVAGWLLVSVPLGLSLYAAALGLLRLRARRAAI